MSEAKAHETRAVVRAHYGEVARTSLSGCAPGCCSPGAVGTAAGTLGYSDDDAVSAPAGADLGLGCGNPMAIASLREGETVLDLGAGAGFDCFIAARQVGPAGRVIGVDMTADMIQHARANARKINATNLEFRLGEIEHLPVADASVDAIISNCVINLSPDKPAVFAEAFRVLRAGGRLAISDIVATAELPVELQTQAAGLRDDERFTSWVFQIARSSVVEHHRTRARHPLPATPTDGDDLAPAPSDDEREAARSLSACVSRFVALLPSPYREAVTLVELEGVTAREAADMAAVSLSAMKSRVQRGRAQLRRVFEDCCEIALDVRGKVTDYAPRPQPRSCCPKPP